MWQSRLQGALQSTDDPRQALECIESLQVEFPEVAELHFYRAVFLSRMDRLPEAADAYRRTLEAFPESIEALNNLGLVLHRLQDYRQAETLLRHAFQIAPQRPEILNSLGEILLAQGRHTDAIVAFEKAIQIRPDSVEALNNLAITLQEQGRLHEAWEWGTQALRQAPHHPAILGNLGNTLMRLSQPRRAVDFYRQAIEEAPHQATWYKHLGNAYEELGQRREAAEAYRQAVQRNPHDADALAFLTHQYQHLCQWEGLEECARKVLATIDEDWRVPPGFEVSPFCFLSLPIETTPLQQRKCAERWSHRRSLSCSNGVILREKRLRPSHSPRLTIGYLSGDFHGHATTWLIGEMLASHNRDEFLVYGYSYGPDDGSPTRARIVSSFDRFVEIGHMDFDRAARTIADDRVDILVDLKGYTTGARSEIVARRPAPIQASYLGYPGTMGGDFIDYLLADDFVIPIDQQHAYSETILYLPGCYQANDSRHHPAEPPNRSDVGLPDQGFVFCSFNNTYKITPRLFDAWMRLLAATAGSVLWLFAPRPEIAVQLRREAEKRGIEGERLVFAPRVPLEEHLGRQRLADLFLDSHPVSAHTTASDALRVGLPLVTWVGDSFASRVAGSLLRTLGLDELIFDHLEAYEAMAWRLANDPSQLALIRRKLAHQLDATRLFDGRWHAQNLEVAYREMWRRYQEAHEADATADHRDGG